jgi:hypothetical protein
MLTTTKTPIERDASATPSRRASDADLEFLAENQQLEGFPGKITEAVATHEPDMQEIAESTQRFGGQIPTEENRLRPPIFQKTNR